MGYSELIVNALSGGRPRGLALPVTLYNHHIYYISIRCECQRFPEYKITIFRAFDLFYSRFAAIYSIYEAFII